MSNVCRGGDLAVREAESRGARDRVRVLVVGFALSSRGALDAAQDIAT